MSKMQITFKNPEEIVAFVNTVSRYDFDMDLKKGRAVVDAKSLLGIMHLGLNNVIELQMYSDHCEELQKELAEMREDFKARKARWENEKASVEKVSKLREEIESVNSEIQIAQRNYDLNKAAELQYGRLPELKKQLEEEEERVKIGLSLDDIEKDRISDYMAAFYSISFFLKSQGVIQEIYYGENKYLLCHIEQYEELFTDIFCGKYELSSDPMEHLYKIPLCEKGQDLQKFLYDMEL